MERTIAFWMLQGVRSGISAGLFSALILYLTLLVFFGHLFESTPGYALALLLFLTHSVVLFGCFGLVAGLFWWLAHGLLRRPFDIPGATSLCVATCFTFAAAFFAGAWVVFSRFPNRDAITWAALSAVGAVSVALLYILSRPALRRVVLAFIPSIIGTIAVLVLAAIGTAVGAVVHPASLSRLSEREMNPVAVISWADGIELAAAVRSTREQADAGEPEIDLAEAVRDAREHAGRKVASEDERDAAETDEGVTTGTAEGSAPSTGEGTTKEAGPGATRELGTAATTGGDAEVAEVEGEAATETDSGPGEAEDEVAAKTLGEWAKPEDLNILLITVGTLRADHLGCYGYARNTSPSIDSLAAAGTLFLNAYAQRPKTGPSVATILTSTYPQQHGVRAARHTLPDVAYTMAEMLKDLGYATCGVVTNGNLFPAFGFDQGFEEYSFSHSDAHAATKVAIEWVSRSREEPFFLWLHYTDPHAPYAPPPPYDRLFVDDMAERGGVLENDIRERREPDGSDAVRVRSMAEGDGAAGNDMGESGESAGGVAAGGKSAAKRDGAAAHEPAGEEARDDGRHAGRSLRVTKRGTLGGVFEHLLIDGPLDLDYYISQYDGEVAYADRWCGELLSTLRALGLSRNTLVVVASDHGESLGEHDYYFEHGLFAYDPSARVPLIFCLPGVVGRGVRDDETIESVDFLPTILDLIGANVPSSCRGMSVAGRLAPGFSKALRLGDETFFRNTYGRGYAYVEAGYGNHTGPGRTFAVTDGRFKLIVRDVAWVLRPRNVRRFLYSLNALFEGGADGPELYDTVQDPAESVNLIGRRPAEEVLLKAELYDFLGRVRQSGTMPRDTGEVVPDEQTIRALRALGYAR